jgi:hypothetical protein
MARRAASEKVKISLREGGTRFPVFNYDVLFIETTNIELAAQHLNLSPMKLPDAQAATWTSNDGNRAYIFVHPKELVNVIVHECWHVINHMFKNRGMDFEEEAVAYHLDYLVLEALKFFQGKKKKNAKSRRRR